MALQVQLITLCTIADLICGPSRTLEETAMHGVTRRNDRNVSRPMHTRSGRVLWPGFQPPQCPVTADRASKPRPSGGLRAPLSDRFVSDVRAKRSTSSAVQPAWLSGATSRRSRRIAFCPADRWFSQLLLAFLGTTSILVRFGHCGGHGSRALACAGGESTTVLRGGEAHVNQRIPRSPSNEARADFRYIYKGPDTNY